MKRKMQLKRLLLSFCLMLICALQLHAQTKKISGTVISDEGSPLSKVSVTVQGASSGTTTDEQGRFTINVPPGKTKLVFSYTGFISQTMNIGNNSIIDITLARDTKQLSDVVVTALGVTKQKKSLGYA
ncbi:MAG: carboxypeptidase-like regulatory domain-containing protein, partial [Bacteroidetes bacterium]|nr:carboxypeptidase-like regulatory domain-containing protein [Bacteroidota bacterium]